MVSHTVGPMEAGKKVHRLVRQLLPGVPLSGIHKMLRVGRVRLNGKKAKPDALVAEGDVLELRMAEEDFAVVSKPTRKYGGVPREIDVIYEDETLLAVNKPMGLLTHGTAEEQRDTLANRVLAYLFDKGELDNSGFAPAPANRLDRNTSGIILFGKTGDMARELANGFKDHTIRKWYLAVVKGHVKSGGKIDVGLSRDPRRNLTRVDEESGKASFTVYDPLASANGTSIVRLELISGRTHQIRAHMQHIGHPLVSDRKYQGGKVIRRPAGSMSEKAGRGMGKQQPSSRYGSISDAEEPKYLLHAAWLRLPMGDVLHAPLPVPYRQQLLALGYPEDVISKLESEVPE